MMIASQSASADVVGRDRQALADERRQALGRDVLDRRLAARERLDRVCVHVEADDVRGRLGKGDGKRQADVAEADDPDFHAISLVWAPGGSLAVSHDGDAISRPRAASEPASSVASVAGSGARPPRVPGAVPGHRSRRRAGTPACGGDRERRARPRRCPPRTGGVGTPLLELPLACRRGRSAAPSCGVAAGLHAAALAQARAASAVPTRLFRPRYHVLAPSIGLKRTQFAADKGRRVRFPSCPGYRFRDP